MLRSRTDQFLRDIAAGNFRQLNQYYAPNAQVDLKREIQHHLGGSLGELSLYSWKAATIGFELSDDGLRARTGVEVLLQGRNNEFYKKGVLLNWSRSDTKDMTFYLLPQVGAAR